MQTSYFITGTDTGVGKTTFALKLIHDLQQKGHKIAAFKPVACGGKQNDDALKFQKQLNDEVPYNLINPFCFEEPIAPHIAAKNAGIQLTVDKLLEQYQAVQKTNAEFIVIEGAGGWKVPLNEQETLADFAAKIQPKVILVVAMRLGCINHALLTKESIESHGCKLAGWYPNIFDPNMDHLEENIAAIQDMLGVDIIK